MELKETPISSSFLGFVKKGDCPVCGSRVTRQLGSDDVLCAGCGDYVVFGKQTLRRMDPSSMFPAPYFAAPTQWDDLECPTFGAALEHPIVALTQLATTKQEGVRLLEARWPAGCCVCGKDSSREESIAQRLGFAPPNGLKPRPQKETTVVANGVPHCAEHKNGARFERARTFGDSGLPVLGIFFRSYAYQIEFRKLNPWKWRRAAV
jgi:hypothetical protein